MIKVAIAEDDYRVALLHERYLEDLKGWSYRTRSKY